MIFKWKLKLDSSVFLEKVRGLKSQPCNQLETIAIIYIYSDEIQKKTNNRIILDTFLKKLRGKIL